MSSAAPIVVRLPDGSTKQVPAGSNALDVASAIGSRLAKAAVAAGWGNIDPDITMGLVAPIIAGAVFFIARRARRALTQDEGSA